MLSARTPPRTAHNSPQHNPRSVVWGRSFVAILQRAREKMRTIIGRWWSCWFSMMIMLCMSSTVFGLAAPDVMHEVASSSSSKRARAPVAENEQERISAKNTNAPDHTVISTNKRTRTRRIFLEAAAGAVVASSLTASGNGPSTSSWALSPEQASTDYDAYAPSYNGLDGGQASSLLGIDEARSLLFQKARGDVLEIGAGTGLNLDKYDASRIKSLTLLDISEGMLQQARLRVDQLSSSSSSSSFLSSRLQKIPIRFVRADATTSLVETFGPNAFDTVVDSFSLCVMGNTGARQCLEQMSRVVKSSNNRGQILLLENSRSSNPWLGLYQDVTAEAAASVGGKGCVYNQDVAAMIQQQSTPKLNIHSEVPYAAGLFRAFEVIRVE
jgi:methyltransferase OMS1, mitochondrial